MTVCNQGTGGSTDAVGQRDQCRPVGDDQGGAAHHQAPHGGQHVGLGFGVEARGRLVEKQQRRVAHEGTGQGHALALAGGQSGASLAEQRVRTVGESCHRRRSVRPLRGRQRPPRRRPRARPTGRCRPPSGRTGEAAEVPSRCWPRQSSSSRSARSTPPRVTLPTSGSRRPRTTERSVDLPHPLGPVSATVSPGSTDMVVSVERRDAPSRIGDVEPGDHECWCRAAGACRRRARSRASRADRRSPPRPYPVGAGVVVRPERARRGR